MHLYLHTTFGICLWNILTVCVLGIMVTLMVCHIIRQRKRAKKFEKQLSEIQDQAADEAPSSGV